MDHFLNRTFPQLFAERVNCNPRRLAAVSADGELSYAQLNARANQLARYLRQLGVGPDTLVGICLERSLGMAVGILGILKSGAAYLPLDPDYPAERLALILKDSQLALVLTKTKLANRLPQSSAQLVLLDAEQARIGQQSDSNLDDSPKPNDLAYVIYTSGSTGEPKGVMINHASLANYVLALQNELQLNPNDVYLHAASIAFSSSRRQLLLPLSEGATVVIASSEQRKDPLALFEMIKQRGVTVMDAVPSFWRNCTAVLSALDRKRRETLLDNQLRLMLSASEPLLSDIPQTWVHEFKHRARHVHMFGQTETAGIVSVYEIPREENGNISVVPIGRPIANTEIHILDEQRKPVPVGVPGELYIGGAGIGRGYLHRPELTAEKFIVHPFSKASGMRLYRTGDWARYRLDGQIEFVGRQDSQVKVRGFRVELGEVETILARYSGIKEVVVAARQERDGTKQLVAYFVPRDNPPTVSDLRAFLSERVPDYMVPSNFVQLKALPLTANDKVDRRALPEPDEQRPDLANAYESPQTSTEKLLAQIWSEVLRIERIGINDNFFELGGDSLLAIQVIARINGQLKIIAPISMLFDSPTIRELAEKIAMSPVSENLSQAPQRIRRDQEIPLSCAQERLWFLDQLEPGSPLYNINKALRLRGALDVTRLERALQSIAARHEILRTTFVAPEGRPAQVIAPSIRLPLKLADLRSTPAAAREKEAQRLLNMEAGEPFDLSRGPLARICLVRVANDEHILLLSIHHSISDAWAIKSFFQELANFYQSPNGEESLPELPIQYADFADWQRKRLNGEALEQQLAYWKKQLAGAPLTLDLATDRPRPALLSFRGAQKSISLSQSLSESLKELTRREGVTLFMTLVAAFQTLLWLYSGQDDMLIGIPVAGRTLVETEALMGCFVNTLVLRAKLSGNPSLRDVIKRTREAAIGAYAHQEIPFEKLVEELQPERNLSRSPLFQVMFVLQDESQPELALPGITVSAVPVETDTSKFELALGVVETTEALEVRLSYSTDLFEAGSITCMLEDFKRVLESIVADSTVRLSVLPKPSRSAKVRSSEKKPNSTEQQDPQSQKEYLMPRTPIEERLARIWSEVLGLEKVAVYENFFELGGHSLLAAQVISRARNAFSVELPLRRLFETPTVAGLAEGIYEMQTADTEDEELAGMLAELSQLSEEEAQRLFAQEL